MNQRYDLTAPGEFVVGCNYWASHAGMYMWRDWQPEVVEKDLKALSAAGMQVLRVFPLWPDFQPITQLYGGQGCRIEIRHGDQPLPDTPCGQAGISAEAMSHFADFLDMLEHNNLQCIIGILTGWMSGRLFVPPALEGLNVITDPLAIKWELRFVRHFVESFKSHPAICGWDLGNECNCMGQANHEQAYAWTATISNAIRAIDDTHPVISGMHGLTPEGQWTIQDQGELTDLLTTHPYPLFTPHCDQDPINTIRPISHSAAESRFYADISGKPCLCQEIGTLGPMIASEENAADFARNCLFSLWATDCHGMLWWCAYDQTNLTHAPYDWITVERELGLLRLDDSPKPVIQEMNSFRQFIEGLPFDTLPLRICDAVCILTRDQDQWGAAFSSFILAKQAGFDIEFQFASQSIKDAPLYLMPSVSGNMAIWRSRMNELLARVEAGASLYISLDDALPAEFESLFGLIPQTREKRRDCSAMKISGIYGSPDIPCGGSFKIKYNVTRATVLGAEVDGNPAFTVCDYGKGKIYLLTVPLETTLANTPGAFHSGEALPCWRLYHHLIKDIQDKVILKNDPMVFLTQHPVDDNRRLIIAINMSPHSIDDLITISPEWKIGPIHRGSISRDGTKTFMFIPNNDAAVFEIERIQ